MCFIYTIVINLLLEINGYVTRLSTYRSLTFHSVTSITCVKQCTQLLLPNNYKQLLEKYRTERVFNNVCIQFYIPLQQFCLMLSYDT